MVMKLAELELWIGISVTNWKSYDNIKKQVVKMVLDQTQTRICTEMTFHPYRLDVPSLALPTPIIFYIFFALGLVSTKRKILLHFLILAK